MPIVSEELQKQIALPSDLVIVPDYFVPMLSAGHKTGVPYPLFHKLDNTLAEQFKARFAGQRATPQVRFNCLLIYGGDPC